jgi:hypothetical protein
MKAVFLSMIHVHNSFSPILSRLHGFFSTILSCASIISFYETFFSPITFPLSSAIISRQSCLPFYFFSPNLFFTSLSPTTSHQSFLSLLFFSIILSLSTFHSRQSFLALLFQDRLSFLAVLLLLSRPFFLFYSYSPILSLSLFLLNAVLSLYSICFPQCSCISNSSYLSIFGCSM